MKRIGLVLVVALAALVAVPTAMAAETYTLFDDAELVSPGNGSPHAVQVRSDATPGWGGIDFLIPEGTTFADLTTLSTDYMFEADDSCGGGSPRFQVNVDSGAGDTGNMFVYIGPPPSQIGCPPSVWQNSGDLLEGTNQVDTTQLDSGAYYDTYSAALTKYGSYAVTGVQVVVDSGWFFSDDSEQTVFIDNTNVAGTLHTYETTSDLLGQLQTDTADLVENRNVERKLLASLARAEKYLDAGKPQFVDMALYQYILQVQLYEFFGLITPEAADQLTTQAQQLITSMD